MIAVVDYGLGNLNSVCNMLRYIGGRCFITHEPEQIVQAEKLILPGVGSFDSGIGSIRQQGLEAALNHSVLENKAPILGICLGMQLMTEKSEEGSLPGLGWIKAEVKKFAFNNQPLKIPHMGWNTIDVRRSNPLLEPTERQRFYFVHSYHVVCEQESDIIASCDYGYSFAAAFGNHNIYGVQFHPEKSHRFGMAVMRRFVEMRTC